MGGALSMVIGGTGDSLDSDQMCDIYEWLTGW